MKSFFRAGSSSSGSSSSESEEEEVIVNKHAPARTFILPSDSEDEQAKRVVRAHKDRKFDELKELIHQSRNARNIKDYSKMQTIFEDLCKVFDKSKTVLSRSAQTTPRFFLRHLSQLEDFLNEQWDNKESREALSKPNAKALSVLRQKVRKYNKDHEEELVKYRDNPDPAGYSTQEDDQADGKAAEKSDDDDDDDDDDDADDDVKPIQKVSKPKKKAPAGSDSDESWASDSSDTNSSSDEEIDINEQQIEVLRRFFLKKEFRDEEVKKKDRPRRPKGISGKIKKDDDDGVWVDVVSRREQRNLELFDPKQEITHELMVNKLSEVIAGRGRKTTNRKVHVKQLQELFRISEEKNLGSGLLIKIKFAIISSLFELNTRFSDFMDYATWLKTLKLIDDLIDLLEDNPEVELSIRVEDDEESLKSDGAAGYRVHGSVLMAVERLDSELTKMLQSADQHSHDYVEKLKGEKELCMLIEKAQLYMEKTSRRRSFTSEELCKMYMLRIEHTYYKYEDMALEAADGEQPADTIQRLCKHIYALDDEKRLRQRAVLCHIYHLALHDDWQRARDLMLMSHLQAIVDHSDVPTQILYNRTLCQVALCAFRHGLIKETHQALYEIQNTQKTKELLAQGLGMRQQERTAEQEKMERQRQLPYHMHINVELLECVYLICSMFLEIPALVAHEQDTRKRLLSRSFHHQLKVHEKSALVGPPENTREHVVAATRAMLRGDWKAAHGFLVNEKMNAKVWNLFRDPAKVRAIVTTRLQEESLRTYLLAHATVYVTVSLDTLGKMFDLGRQQVHSIIARMIIEEELCATLDEPSDSLIMHRQEPSRLQQLSLGLADKLSSLADASEQIVEPRVRHAHNLGASEHHHHHQRGILRGPRAPPTLMRARRAVRKW